MVGELALKFRIYFVGLEDVGGLGEMLLRDLNFRARRTRFLFVDQMIGLLWRDF